MKKCQAFREVVMTPLSYHENTVVPQANARAVTHPAGLARGREVVAAVFALPASFPRDDRPQIRYRWSR